MQASSIARDYVDGEIGDRKEIATCYADARILLREEALPVMPRRRLQASGLLKPTVRSYGHLRPTVDRIVLGRIQRTAFATIG